MEEENGIATINLTKFAETYNAKWVLACNHHKSDVATLETRSGRSIRVKPETQRHARLTHDNVILLCDVPYDCKIIGFVVILHLHSDSFDEDAEIKFWDMNFTLGCGCMPNILDDNRSKMEVRLGEELRPVLVRSSTIIDIVNHRYATRRREFTGLIPHTIHFIWLGNKPFPDENYIETWKTLHPNFDIILWSDRPGDQTLDDRVILRSPLSLLESYPGIRRMYDEVHNPGFRSDLIRYLALDAYGGVYVDVNDFDALRSIETIISSPEFVCGAEPFVCTTSDVVAVNNAFIACTSRHPIMRRMINLVQEMYSNEHRKTLLETSDRVHLDDTIATVSGVAAFRMVVCGYILEKGGHDTIVVPSVVMYPCCFYDPESLLHRCDFRGDVDDWTHAVTVAAHYSKHEYLKK